MSVGKVFRIILTILWLIVYAPVAFLVGLTIPHINKLVRWAQDKDLSVRQKIFRFLAIAPIMIIFLPLVFIVSAGSKAIETGFTKHL